MIDLSLILDQKISLLEKHISSAVFERDHAATPMESASDKTRQLAEQKIDALRDEKDKLNSLKRSIKNYRPKLYTLGTAQGERQFLLVPEGLGGQTFNGYTLLSINSPLGEKLLHTRQNDAVGLNGNQYTILDIQ